MADALRKRIWAGRLSWWALALSLGGVVAALIGAIGSGQGLWPFMTGFLILRWAFYAAVAGGVLAIAAWFMARRAPGSLGIVNLVALAVAIAFAAYLLVQVRTARSVPPIHDVTTNLDSVPRFFRLSLREDNLDNVPAEGDPELMRMAPVERWRALHREAYGDLATIQVPWSVDETVRRAEALARERGWEVASADARGIVEATDTSTFFRFKDDVVVRVTPNPTGGSHVDMRSVSRVGVSDVGVNAKRIRAFLDDLRAN